MTSGADAALDPKNPELEAAIIAKPKDDAAWRVYADWLNERGAVRGQLAALQLAREERKLPSLRKKAEALLEEHADLFYPPDATPYKMKWKAGFWQRLTINSEPEEPLHETLSSRNACLLQSLTASGCLGAEDAIEALVKSGPHPALRRLTFNEVREYGNADVGNFAKSYAPGLAKLPASVPNLRALHLTADAFDFPSFPKLAHLVVYAGIASSDALRALFAVDLPRLKTMKLSVGEVPEAEHYLYHASQDLTPFSLDAFEGLLDAKRVPRLTKLEINTDVTGDSPQPRLEQLKKMLAGSAIEKQVTELVLK